MIYVVIALLLLLGISVYWNFRLYRYVRLLQSAMRWQSDFQKKVALGFGLVILAKLISNAIRSDE